MSGHSHFATIKHKKGIADAKRGKVFSKMARVITIAAKEKGADPDTNPGLRMAIDQAKKVNMPKDNIERAIKKGTGELAGDNLEEITLEAYGPEKTAIILEGITDNRNRTLSEVKIILNQYNGKLANEGSVKWLFDKKGIIVLNVEGKDKEELELTVIEAGADDITWEENLLHIYTKPEELEKVKKNLEGHNIESANLGWVPKETIEVSRMESIQKLFEALDDNDDVQEIYSNLK